MISAAVSPKVARDVSKSAKPIRLAKRAPYSSSKITVGRLGTMGLMMCVLGYPSNARAQPSWVRTRTILFRTPASDDFPRRGTFPSGAVLTSASIRSISSSSTGSMAESREFVAEVSFRKQLREEVPGDASGVRPRNTQRDRAREDCAAQSVSSDGGRIGVKSSPTVERADEFPYNSTLRSAIVAVRCQNVEGQRSFALRDVDVESGAEFVHSLQESDDRGDALAGLHLRDVTLTRLEALGKLRLRQAGPRARSTQDVPQNRGVADARERHVYYLSEIEPTVLRFGYTQWRMRKT